MKTYVLDASVAVAVLLNESKETKVLLRKVEREVKAKKAVLCAPDLLCLEVANALRHKLEILAEAQDLYKKFLLIPIVLVPVAQNQIDEVLSWAYSTDAAIYDVLYHYVAKTRGGIFLTSDKNYFEKAKRLGSIEFVS